MTVSPPDWRVNHFVGGLRQTQQAPFRSGGKPGTDAGPEPA